MHQNSLCVYIDNKLSWNIQSSTVTLHEYSCIYLTKWKGCIITSTSYQLWSIVVFYGVMTVKLKLACLSCNLVSLELSWISVKKQQFNLIQPLHWLPFSHKYKCHVAVLVFKSLNGIAPITHSHQCPAMKDTNSDPLPKQIELFQNQKPTSWSNF